MPFDRLRANGYRFVMRCANINSLPVCNARISAPKRALSVAALAPSLVGVMDAGALNAMIRRSTAGVANILFTRDSGAATKTAGRPTSG